MSSWPSAVAAVAVGLLRTCRCCPVASAGDATDTLTTAAVGGAGGVRKPIHRHYAATNKPLPRHPRTFALTVEVVLPFGSLVSAAAAVEFRRPSIDGTGPHRNFGGTAGKRTRSKANRKWASDLGPRIIPGGVESPDRGFVT